MTIIHFCAEGIRNAECGIASEKLAGNIVKEEHWKGEACAYRAMYAALKDVEAANSATDNNESLAIALLNEAKEYSKQVGNLESDSHFLKYITERWRSANASVS